jgi:hypothetical protein
MRRFAILLPSMLAACGAWPNGSYVSAVSRSDANVLAPEIADYVAEALPAGSMVAVVPAQGSDWINPGVIADLNRDGLSQSPAGTPIRYVAMPLDTGILLRISIADREGASRYFARAADGTLGAAGPLTVMTP